MVETDNVILDQQKQIEALEAEMHQKDWQVPCDTQESKEYIHSNLYQPENITI